MLNSDFKFILASGEPLQRNGCPLLIFCGICNSNAIAHCLRYCKSQLEHLIIETNSLGPQGFEFSDLHCSSVADFCPICHIGT